MRFPYLAEETEGTGATTAPTFDKDEMMNFIKEGTKTALKEAIESAPKTEPRVESTGTANPFAEWIDPLVTPKLQQAQLTAQAAEDKVDFYSSEEWLTEVDDWLCAEGKSDEETATLRKQEKAAIRADVEKTFQAMLKAGKGTFRKDLLSYVLGEKMKRDKAAFTESIGKRSAKQKEAALDKARRGVDISSGAISNFVAADVHKMDTAKMLEQYGGVAF